MMNRVLARLFLLALVGILVFPALSDAQITRGAVSGTVRDASGAAVPGASVTVTNMDTNISRTAVTDAVGFFRVPALEPGRYQVKAELSGFSTVEYKDIRLVSASEVTVNPELKVAGVGEAITVVGRAEAIELNKTSATIGTTTMARQVVELPLSAGRDVNNLIATAPNVSRVTGQGTFAANGQRSRNNNYMIDGSDNNDISVTIATSQLVPEAVAEFQVQTNAYSVEFGRNSGAQVNVITKSGTNTFRGEVWDYFRTNEPGLADEPREGPGPGRSRPSSPATRWGRASAGRSSRTGRSSSCSTSTTRSGPRPRPAAPVRIPTQSGFSALAGVPLRAGQPASSRQAVLDRLSFLNDVYAQNPAFRNLNTQLVNGVPIETGQTNVNITQPSTYHYFMGRIDHRLTDSDNLTLRYYYNKRQDTDQVSNLQFGPIFAGSQDLKDTNLAASHTHIFGPSVVNEFRFSWVQRDLLFPENDPTSPTAAISGLFTDRRPQQLPAGPRHRLLPVLEHGDLDEEPPHPEVRRGRALQQGLQPVRLQLEGQLHVQQPAGLHEQLGLQPHAGPADGQLGREAVADVLLRPGRLPGHPRPHPERRPALRAVRRAARPLRRHRRREPRRPRAPAAGQGHEQLGAAHRLQLVPAVLERHPRRRQDRLPRRLRDGLRRALLQPAHGQRLELPAHRHREHQQRPRHLPEPAPGRRQPRLQPAQRVDQLRRRTRRTPTRSSGASPSGASSASS